MSRTFLFILFSGALALQVTSFHFPTNCSGRHMDITYMVQYKPFIFCGRVTAITPVSVEYFNIESHQIDRDCMIGCVNRTAQAVSIEIYNCDYDQDFIVPPYFDDLEFADCHSDEQFTLRGSTPHSWMELELRPNISCMRNKGRSTCGRIFSYSRRYLRESRFYDHLETGVVQLDLNRTIWPPYIKNGTDNAHNGTMYLTVAYILTIMFMTRII